MAEVDSPDAVTEPWSAVEHLVRTFRASSSDETELVSHICAEAVTLIEPADDAGVILAGGRRNLAIIATTGPVPQRLDELQQETGSGPCLTAARTQKVVHVPDIASETRWAGFPAAARAAGVGSMLCLPLHVDGTTFGTLSVYSGRPEALAVGAEPVARVLGVLAAITLSETRRTGNLEKALHNRDMIGQAKGIIMHAQRVTADEAFRLLVERSQNTNVKLAALAEKVVESGVL